MKPVITSGKRKRAIARAVVKDGTGVVRINHLHISAYKPIIAKVKLEEPLIIAGPSAAKFDIDIKVQGGGIMNQADAARLAIAKGLVAASKDKKLEKRYLDYDRHLLVADVRRKEVSKPNRHGKARAKRQKSYR